MNGDSPSEATLHGLNRRQFLAASAGGSVTVAGCLGLFDETGIEDWHDLNAVREGLDGEYVLVNDLDEGTAGYDEHVGDPEAGWEPIGDIDAEADAGFTGSLDGQGHEIADLQVDRPETTYVGLLAGSEGTIENVTVTDAAITGRAAVGGLLGELLDGGELSASSVRGADITGERLVGGLAGVVAIGAVSASSVRGADVTGEEEVGGLLGRSRFECEVAETYVRDVTISGGRRVGGLLGQNGGEVVDSWVAGDVTGENAVGGFVGAQLGDGAITAGYWDVEATGQESGLGDGGGDVTGLRTDEMHAEAATEHMDALDFEGTWATRTDPDDYPVSL